MSKQEILLSYVTAAITGGLFGTLCISVAIFAAGQAFHVSLRPLESIGTVFVRDKQMAVAIGSALHLFAGLAFAFVYALALQILALEKIWSYAGVGAAMGLCHGFVLFFVLIPPLAEHHPSDKVRARGPILALLIALAHILYGAAVGLAVGIVSI